MQMLVHMPSYTPPKMLEAFASGKLPSTPGVASGVHILTGTMLTMINRWVLDRQHTKPEFVYPYFHVFDPIDGMKTVHADDRVDNLMRSIDQIGSNLQSSGFSLPDEYVTM
jgi:hypothetical protein